jgi:hypothetical protein
MRSGINAGACARAFTQGLLSAFLPEQRDLGGREISAHAQEPDRVPPPPRRVQGHVNGDFRDDDRFHQPHMELLP